MSDSATEFEMNTLTNIVRSFDGLPDDMARKRVLQYLTDRHRAKVEQKYAAETPASS